MWTLVGAGLKTTQQSSMSQTQCVPQRANWMKTKVAGFDPDENTVYVASAFGNKEVSSSSYSELRRKRYQTFDSGTGKDFEEGKLELTDLYEIAKGAGEISLESGKQELFENILNQYI